MKPHGHFCGLSGHFSEQCVAQSLLVLQIRNFSHCITYYQTVDIQMDKVLGLPDDSSFHAWPNYPDERFIWPHSHCGKLSLSYICLSYI